jgi:hypothetical protein
MHQWDQRYCSRDDHQTDQTRVEMAVLRAK